MRFLRNSTQLFGWLSFYMMTHSLLLLLALPFRGKDFQVLSDLIAFILLLLAFYILVSFLSFIISIKHVVIPLHQKNKIDSSESGRVKLPAYLFYWFDYLFYWVVFCVPLICWAALAPSVENVISLLWQLVASYLSYRLVVSRWMKEIMSPDRFEDNNQIRTA